jgi:RimK family alpha-L-glutamate ligase
MRNNNYDLLVFTEAPKAYAPRRIVEEGNKIGFSVDTISYKRIDFKVEDKKVTCFWKGMRLPGAKAVIFRELNPARIAYNHRNYLISHFQAAGSYVLNAKSYLKWPYLDKLTQHFEFQKANIPFIQTFNFGSNLRLIEFGQKYGFPFIAKHHLSSRGREVFKIENFLDLKNLSDKGYKARTLLIQPFCKVGEDLRVIVVGGKVVGAMKRIAREGNYLTNYSQGGFVESFDLAKDKLAMEISKRAVGHFYLDYVGVDLMKGNSGKWKVLEVNRGCQFEGFEKATGINMARKIVQYCLSRI